MNKEIDTIFQKSPKWDDLVDILRLGLPNILFCTCSTLKEHRTEIKDNIVVSKKDFLLLLDTHRPGGMSSSRWLKKTLDNLLKNNDNAKKTWTQKMVDIVVCKYGQLFVSQKIRLVLTDDKKIICNIGNITKDKLFAKSCFADGGENWAHPYLFSQFPQAHVGLGYIDGELVARCLITVWDEMHIGMSNCYTHGIAQQISMFFALFPNLTFTPFPHFFPYIYENGDTHFAGDFVQREYTKLKEKAQNRCWQCGNYDRPYHELGGGKICCDCAATTCTECACCTCDNHNHCQCCNEIVGEGVDYCSECGDCPECDNCICDDHIHTTDELGDKL